jgi:hypothetical protein
MAASCARGWAATLAVWIRPMRPAPNSPIRTEKVLSGNGRVAEREASILSAATQDICFMLTLQ